MQSKLVIAALLGAVSANQYDSLKDAVNTQKNKALSTAAVKKQIDNVVNPIQDAITK